MTYRGDCHICREKAVDVEAGPTRGHLTPRGVRAEARAEALSVYRQAAERMAKAAALCPEGAPTAHGVPTGCGLCHAGGTRPKTTVRCFVGGW